MKLFAAAVLFAAALGQTAFAEEKSAAQNAFDKIKALAGDWEVTKQAGEHAAPVGTKVTYKATAGGSTIVEMLFCGSGHEMMTTYYLDGGNLGLTHYCTLKNRPQMRAEPLKDNKLVFTLAPNDKLASETHMHQVTFTFIDSDNVKTEWLLYKDGKPQGTHAFELARKK